ncbi:MAG: succinyl-CoA ligase subunit alpha [Ignavibacteriales bacterium]
MLSEYCKILSEIKSIAVVGISDKPERDSGSIAKMLKEKGYTVYGVHPYLKEVFGIPVYSSLADLPEKVDLVDVFLSSDKVPAILNGVTVCGAKYLWLQLGVTNTEAEEFCAKEKIGFIQNRCIAVEYRNCATFKGLI